MENGDLDKLMLHVQALRVIQVQACNAKQVLDWSKEKERADAAWREINRIREQLATAAVSPVMA